MVGVIILIKTIELLAYFRYYIVHNHKQYIRDDLPSLVADPLAQSRTRKNMAISPKA